ncbi:hypothetical protein J2Z52_002544 [Enterococcus rivorum]|nr:hypothetical protein [Enterococcus rivorum]
MDDSSLKIKGLCPVEDAIQENESIIIVYLFLINDK